MGVDTIAAEIGISKRTLYNHFPSKDALIEAYLQRRFVQPRPSDKPPAEQILATFDSLERRFAAKDFRGCPFVNAVASSARRTRTAAFATSPSPSRKAAGSGFAICCGSSASPMRRDLQPSSRCWSTDRSPRTWCATIRPWRARPGKRRACCWPTPASRSAAPRPRTRNALDKSGCVDRSGLVVSCDGMRRHSQFGYSVRRD
ncbi:TetR/AcrR family transcriptional regulator [Bradyrhizobium viridifuturi]|uniref:TetR/AcrR family transcriptional regulator n=1 Tax=Bradyrhizobium viridifuturi TaxID=1654716 RepID=UPI001FCD5B6F|nr:TetR/AcrR family transcriptional regulator [Bradyrhizobium viridifuturi]